MNTEVSEEEEKRSRGWKKMRSEVSVMSRVSERSSRGSRSADRGRQDRRIAHRSRERRTEMGGEIIERHWNKVIMLRKGRN